MKVINYLLITLITCSFAQAMEQEEKFVMSTPEDIQRVKDDAAALISDLKDFRNTQEYKFKLIQNQYNIFSLRMAIQRILLNEPLSDEEKKLFNQLYLALAKFETDRMQLARDWGYEAGELY